MNIPESTSDSIFILAALSSDRTVSIGAVEGSAFDEFRDGSSSAKAVVGGGRNLISYMEV
jgi:hypothetical protein